MSSGAAAVYGGNRKCVRPLSPQFLFPTNADGFSEILFLMITQTHLITETSPEPI